MALTDQEVVRIARLARLHLTEAQQTQAKTDLNKILGIIQTIQAVDKTTSFLGINKLHIKVAS